MWMLEQVTLSAGRYLHWGVVSISLTNLLVILSMVLVFLAAVLIPFPHRDSGPARSTEDER